MTPSGWGDAAQERDAGHDEMQARVYRDLLRMTEAKEFVIRRRVNQFSSERKDFIANYVEVERPFVADGRLIGFADIAVQFKHEEEYGHTKEIRRTIWWLYYEIKPRIYSVGAVIRQCKATEINAGRAQTAAQRARSGSSEGTGFDVMAVVYDDDPKTELLRELYPSVFRLGRKSSEENVV